MRTGSFITVCHPSTYQRLIHTNFNTVPINSVILPLARKVAVTTKTSNSRHSGIINMADRATSAGF
jgi:hypothetical protein